MKRLSKGTGSSHIVRNIERANQHQLCDVLIVGRGGGSIEDLWAFNERKCGTCHFSSRIPIISAVGHETDTTIADFVADLRAPTPTAAAELAVPHQQELFQRVLASKTQLHQLVSSKVAFATERLQSLMTSYPMATPEKLYRPFTERLIQLDWQLEREMKQLMLEKRARLQMLQATIGQHSPMQAVNYAKKQLQQVTTSLTTGVFHTVEQQKQAFQGTIRTLEALNPLAIMQRGFTVTYTNGQLVKSVHQLKQQDDITIAFHDGEVQAKIVALSAKKGE